MDQLISILISLAFPLLLYFLAATFHRLFLSPIRHIPGPVTGKFGLFWQLWHLGYGDYHDAVRAAHKKFGPLVRISHREVSVAGPEAVDNILLRPLRKDDWYKIFAMPDSSWPNLQAEVDPQHFAYMRKRVAKGYTISTVLNSEATMDQAIGLFMSQVDKRCDIAPADWLTYFAFDTIGLATFSRSFGFLEQGKDIDNCITTSLKLTRYLAVMAYFRQIHDFLMANPLIGWLDIQPMKHVINTAIDAVETYEDQEGAVRNDIMAVWKSQPLSKPLTQRELLATANSNLAAGPVDSGCHLQVFLYYVLKHPECLRRLEQEIRTARSKGLVSSPVQYKEAQELEYFQACVNESYRVHPVAATSYPRIAPKEGIEIQGQFFPYGTAISVNPWVIHYDRTIWGDDVDKFVPERWLKPESKGLEKHLITFGAGYMTCPGRAIANAQLSKLLSTLILEYDIELSNPSSSWSVASSLLAWPSDWSVKMKRVDVS